MKKQYYILFVLFLIQYTMIGQSIIELGASESMSIIGKGPGQDAVMNPYPKDDSEGIIENIGKNEFKIRVQKKEDIVKIVTIKPGEIKKVTLLKEYQLYFDSTLKSKAKVTFKLISE